MSLKPVDLSIVVPTYNEHNNVDKLIALVAESLTDVRWELIFVDDDSPDGTAAKLKMISRDMPQVRCIHRIGRRGLSSACVEGVLSSSADTVAIMDADLQHDPHVLPHMLNTLNNKKLDLVIGSRYMNGGGIGDWAADRAAVSRLATRMAALVIGKGVTDPMSGFFMFKRAAFEKAVRHMSNLGFKILFDFLASSPEPLRLEEIPYKFGPRLAGDSKLGANVAFEYLVLLSEKWLGAYIPVRFFLFSCIGALGVLVHFGILGVLLRSGQIRFAVAQALATIAAMVFNFAINNSFTYAGQSLKGTAWFRGLASFMLACGLGALGNVGVASYLFEKQAPWQMAALIGVAMSSVWNYAVTARYTWGTNKGADLTAS